MAGASGVGRASGLEIIVRIVAAGIGVGVLLAVGIEVTATTRAFFLRPRLVAPVKERHGSPSDPAWVHYFPDQGSADYRERLTQQDILFGKTVSGWWTKFPLLVVTGPVLLVTQTMLIVFSFVVAVALAAVAMVTEAAFWLTAGAARLTDVLHALVRRSEASCPTCYEVMDHPAYACPACGALHRDIRAGRLGALHRTCACGHRLPAGILRAAWRLDAVCQRCGAHVHRGAAVLRDVRIPVFGDRHAGKTRLIFAGMHEVVESARRAGLPVTFPDESSRERAEHGLNRIESNGDLVASGWELAPALTCQIGTGTSGALLHVFDAAGGRFRDADGHDELRYLDVGHTLIFVVDPFAIPMLRPALASRPPTGWSGDQLDAAESVHSPEDVYGEVLSRVRAGGTETKRQRLAVVLSKADLLISVGMAPPSQSDALGDWLHARGMHNVVLAAGREFREVRYFAVASVKAMDAGPGLDPAAPFRWALATRGFDLPSAVGPRRRSWSGDQGEDERAHPSAHLRLVSTILLVTVAIYAVLIGGSFGHGPLREKTSGLTPPPVYGWYRLTIVLVTVSIYAVLTGGSFGHGPLGVLEGAAQDARSWVQDALRSR